MKFSAKFDYRELTQAILQTERETGKEFPEILNKVAKDVAFRSWQFTIKAAKGKVAKWLSTPQIQRLVLSRIRKGQDKTYGAGSILTPQQLKQAVTMRIRRMYGSIGYIRTGWAKAIKAFGGEIKGARPKVSEAGMAAGGYGKKAAVGRLVAILVNTATGAEKISGPALQKAIDFKAKDMRDYLAKKMGKTMKAHSAR